MASLATSLRVSSAWVIPINKITFDQEIGYGSFGTVHLGEYQREQVAIKKIKNIHLCVGLLQKIFYKK